MDGFQVWLFLVAAAWGYLVLKRLTYIQGALERIAQQQQLFHSND
jgi:hypothetical protein